MPGRAIPAIPNSHPGVAHMEPVEYKPARRSWYREILVGAAAGVASNLVWELLTVAARLLV